MAIVGVTDKTRMPRLGKIRLGEKRTSARGAEYPAALDHFNFGDVPELQEIYGTECREIFPVLLPSDDEEVWFPTSLSAYGKSGLYCRCSDGQTATRVFNEQDAQSVAYLKETGVAVDPGEMFELPCAKDECPWTKKGSCKRLGRLFIILPNVPRFGVYEISTSSFNSIVNVLNVARAVQSMIGRVSGVPFALKLDPIQVQPDGKAKTIYALNLECRQSLSRLAAIGRRLQAGGGALALIDARDEVPDDLYAHGGAALDATLDPNRKPAPRSLADVTTRMQAPDQPEPRVTVIDVPPERTPEPEPPKKPAPTPAPAQQPVQGGAPNLDF